MNFKKSWKRANEGFTLVELIVVIAILAILAGIAVPAYSGYIKKANKASDLQLLGAVNTAFAAACLENGVSAVGLADGSVGVNWSGNKIVSTTSYAEEFVKYYGDNANSGFKVIDQLTFIGGVFVSSQDAVGQGVTAYDYNGVTVYLSDAQMETLRNGNTFMTASGLGAQGLLDKVNDVTTFASAMDSAAMGKVLKSDDFSNLAASILGLDTNDPDLTNKLQAEMNTLAEEMMKNDPTLSQADAVKKVQANAAVLLAAQSSANQNATDIKALLTGEDVKGDIINTLNANEGAGLSQAAVAYGMYTAYAYNSGDATLIEKTKNPSDILNGLQDEGFQDYMKTEQADKDLAAYMSAMSAVSSSANNKEAASDILVNGYNDPALVALLQQAVGSGE